MGICFALCSVFKLINTRRLGGMGTYCSLCALENFLRMNFRITPLCTVFFVALWALIPAVASAQNATAGGYQTPEPILKKIIDAPNSPQASIDPTQTNLLLLQAYNYPPLKELAETEVRLGGLRINPVLFGPSRRGVVTGVSLLPIAGGPERPCPHRPGWGMSAGRQTAPTLPAPMKPKRAWSFGW
jgi:hypothetical protein